MNNNTNGNQAAGNFSADDIINPVALAGKLTAADTAFAKLLADQMTPAGHNLLAMAANGDAKPKLLAPVLAEVLRDHRHI